MSKKILIIYNSREETQNTKRIATYMAQAIDAQLISISEVDNYKIEDYDLVGFGSGVYFGKFGKSLIKYINNLEPFNQSCFVFYTSGAKKCDKAMNNFIDLLLSKKRKCIGSWHCLGRDVAFTLFKKTGGFNKGRPSEQDCQDAAIFIKELFDK
ncbi:MAG: hypothetical protein LBG49_00855 [Mycoplasmataceae bacterium]|nr:hypothetical protein [Mycoplasmataceae bacterium]